MAQDFKAAFGLGANELPYPADRITKASQEWRVLTRGVQSKAGSLAIAEIGRGRVAVDSDNPAMSGRMQNLPEQSDRFLAQLIAWLAG